MSYIGQSIKNGTFSDLGFTGTFNGSNVTFDLGTQVSSAAQLLVSHDGVIQRPGTDYILASSGTQITFTTAPASGASIFITEISGAVGGPMNRDINGDELILDVDGDTSITADTDDQIDIKVAGADDFQIVANNFKVLSGSTLTIESGGTITNSGTATGFGVALDDVTTGDAAATLATSAGNITIDAQGSDTDIIFKGTDGGSDTTFLTLDGSAEGDATFNGNIILGNGKGIDFSATSDLSDGDATMTSELFDDYEEGTWTATVSSDSGSITVNTSNDECHYTKIGNRIFLSGSIGISSVSSPSGRLTINNKPFDTSGGEGGKRGVISMCIHNPASDEGSGIVGMIFESYAPIRIHNSSSGGEVNSNRIQASSELRFTGFYE